MVRAKIGLVAAALLVGAAVARADGPAGVDAGLADAARARAALRYDEALVLVEATIGLGQASPAQLATLYRTAGELAAGLDRTAQAERWFQRWLALEPDGQLAADASPKLRAPLEAARARAAGRPLALVIRHDGGVVGVATVDDAARVVARIHVVLDGGGRIELAPGASVPVPTGARGQVVAVDAAGNQLVVRPLPPAVAVGVASDLADPAPPLYRRWPVYAGVAAVAGALGGVAAWRSAVAQDEFDRLRADSGAHTFAELDAVRARGERAALLANVGFAAAGVAAVAAGVVAWWPRSDDGAGAPRVGLGAGASGLSLRLTADF